jgi:hypothetical protein
MSRNVRPIGEAEAALNAGRVSPFVALGQPEVGSIQRKH